MNDFNIDNVVLERLNKDRMGNITPIEIPIQSQIGIYGTVILNLKVSNPLSIKVYPNAKNGVYNTNIQEYRYVEGNPLSGEFTYDSNASSLVFNISEVGNHIMGIIPSIGNTYTSCNSVAVDYDNNSQVIKTLGETLEEVIPSSELAKNDLIPLNIKITRHEKSLRDGARCNYTLTTIPYKNSDGTRNEIKKAYHGGINNPTQQGYPRNLAISKKATIATNASAFIRQGDVYKIIGLQICDGRKVNINDCHISANMYTLGVKRDGTLKCYKHASNTQDDLIRDGVTNSFAFSTPIITDGRAWTIEEMKQVYIPSDQRHPRNCIGQDTNKNIYLITTEGRRPNEAGMTLLEVQEIFQSLNCVVAYNLDGGGSAQVLYDGAMVNCPTDARLGFVERMTPDILYVTKERADKKQENQMRKWAIFEKRLFDIINEFKQFGLSKATHDGNYDIETTREDGQNMVNLRTKIHNIINTGFQVIENGRVKLKFALGDTFLRYHNYETDKTIFAVNDSGDLFTQKCIYGLFGKNTKLLDDVHNITECGIFWCNAGTLNRPTDIPCAIQSFGSRGGNYLIILATEWRTGKQHIKSFDGAGWGVWKSEANSRFTVSHSEPLNGGE